jgi:hypothetical protein
MKWNLWRSQRAGVLALAGLMTALVFGQMRGPNACFVLDSLTCVSTDVVEGTLAGVGMAGRIPIRVINFEITVVHQGASQSGQAIPVAFSDNSMKDSRRLSKSLEYRAQLIPCVTEGRVGHSFKAKL